MDDFGHENREPQFDTSGRFDAPNSKPDAKKEKPITALAKVQARGQVTLPREIRRAIGIEPGDTIVLRVTGPGKVELGVLPRLTIDDLAARYPIEGPIDEPADRAAWQEAAAKDVLGQS